MKEVEEVLQKFVTIEHDIEAIKTMYRYDPWFHTIVNTILSGGDVYQFIPKLIEFKNGLLREKAKEQL